MTVKSLKHQAYKPLRLTRPAMLAGVVFILVALSALWASPAHAQTTEEFEPREVVVKLTLPTPAPPPDYCQNTIESIRNDRAGATIKDTLLQNPSVACIYLLELPQGSDTKRIAEEIAADQRVTYAEPNFVIDAPEGSPRARANSEGIPEPSSDPAPYSSQYAVGALSIDCANTVNKGAGATVAVLDSGVRADHPELSGSLTAGYDFVDDDATPEDLGNNMDDDGDGLTDEMVGHGTHVSGIVHLVAPEAKIMPLRVLDSDGTGNVFLIAEAAQYAIKNDADVINMSLGTSQQSELLADIADDLDANTDDDDDGDTPALEGTPPEGVVVTASAGNNGTDENTRETMQYPAADVGVLAVTAVNQNETKTDFSSYGSWVKGVAAPGEDIYSTYTPEPYASWDGTSMAAPFVAGQAALIRSLEPNLSSTGSSTSTTNTVESAIKDTSRSLDAKNPTYNGKLGTGHADVYASLKKLRPNASCGTPPPANTAPTVSNVRPANGTLTRDRTPNISATIKDAQTNLAKSNIRLYVDGKTRTAFAYNAATDRLSYTSSRLSRGQHTVKVTATDAQRLVGSRTWRFRVVR